MSTTHAIIGKGVIILLGGPPGVGKTLTAESSMADCFQIHRFSESLTHTRSLGTPKAAALQT